MVRRIMLVSVLLSAGALGMPADGHGQRSGVEIWSQNCGRCHLPQPANQYTADQWESILYHMRLAARLTDAETEAVLAFLQGGAKRVGSGEAGPAHPADPASGRRLASTASLALFWGGQNVDAKGLYGKLCAPCHGPAGRGDGPVAAALNPRPTDLTKSKVLADAPDEEVVALLRDGKGTMPGFGKQLKAEEVNALVGYLRALTGKERGRKQQ